MVTFGIFDSTILIKILFPKGGVEGGNPLKFFLSKCSVLVEKLDLYLYLTSKNILRAFHKTKYHYRI